MGTIKSYLRVSKEQIVKLSSIKFAESQKYISDEFKEIFDIDKSWQILNYLITGEKDFNENVFTKIIYPDNYTIPTSKEEDKIIEIFYENGMQDETEKVRQILAKQELSFGFVDAEEINAIISELEKLEIKQIIEDADFDTFNEIGIYPQTWSNSEEQKNYVRKHFDNLFSFLKRAKEEEDYIIVI